MSQKVAYVTGGMGGIGTAICQRLHKEGFKVIAGCGPTRDYQKWLDEQKALGYTFYASVGNVGNWDSTVEAFSKTKAEHGTIDVLVNNAGITRDRMFLKMSRDDWDAVIDTNLNSMFNVTKQVVGDMVERGFGIGVVPEGVFRLYAAALNIRALSIQDAWAQRELRVAVRSFDQLPAAARRLVEHLQARSAH